MDENHGLKTGNKATHFLKKYRIGWIKGDFWWVGQILSVFWGNEGEFDIVNDRVYVHCNYIE